MNNNSKNTAPADVAPKAVEDKLVVPAQGTDATVEATDTPADKLEVTVVEGDKKDGLGLRAKARLSSLANLVKEHRKSMALVGVVAGVAGLAFARYAKRMVESEFGEVNSVDDEPALTLGDLSDHPDDESSTTV